MRGTATVVALALWLAAASGRAAGIGAPEPADSSKAPAAESAPDEPTRLEPIVVTPLDPLYDTDLYRRLARSLPTLGADGQPKKKPNRLVRLLEWALLPSEPPAEIDHISPDVILAHERDREMGVPE